MLETIANHLDSIAALAPTWGLLFIFVFMTIESSFIPFPSEVVMIPAGFLAARGELGLGSPTVAVSVAVAVGILGSLAGAYANYYLSLWVGKPFLEKYGKYFFIKPEPLARACEVFNRYGAATTFVCRLVPVIRQLISIPAGIARMPLGSFTLFTGLGAGIWTTVLALVGYAIGRSTGDITYLELCTKGKAMASANLPFVIGGAVILVGLYLLASKLVMKKRACTVLLALLLAIPAFGSVAELREGDFTVRPNPCPTCAMRMRFSPDGKTAFINTTRVNEKDFAAASEYAFDLMKKAADTAKGGALRPLMGWSSWNTFGLDIHEELIISVARAMATNGLKKAGYLYVNTDDGFFAGHDKTTGRLKWHLKRFPRGMKPVVDAIHALGLKAGTYSDAGEDTCGAMWGQGQNVGEIPFGSGLYGHDREDFDLHFKEIGFDFIKIDYCGGSKLKLDEKARYTEIARGIAATGRKDVRINICRWAFPGVWAADVAGSWRTTEDIRANWKSVKKLIGENLYLGAYISPGHYNDLDMLQVGRYAGEIRNAYEKDDVGLTLEEEATHFGMWAFFSSPLLIGCDVRNLPATTYELITNPFLLMMNQNDLAAPPMVVRREGEAYILVKDADTNFGRARYLALYNAEDAAKDFTVNFAELELGGKLSVLDLGERALLDVKETGFKVNVPAHGAKFYRLDAEERFTKDETIYEAEAAYLAEYQELVHPEGNGKPFFVEEPTASGGVTVRGLGNRASNDLIWKTVRVPKDATYRLEIKTFSKEPRCFTLEVDGEATRASAIPLKAGVHTVRLFNAKGPMPDIDALVVTLSAKGAR